MRPAIKPGPPTRQAKTEDLKSAGPRSALTEGTVGNHPLRRLWNGLLSVFQSVKNFFSLPSTRVATPTTSRAAPSNPTVAAYKEALQFLESSKHSLKTKMKGHSATMPQEGDPDNIKQIKTLTKEKVNKLLAEQERLQQRLFPHDIPREVTPDQIAENRQAVSDILGKVYNTLQVGNGYQRVLNQINKIRTSIEAKIQLLPETETTAAKQLLTKPISYSKSFYPLKFLTNSTCKTLRSRSRSKSFISRPRVF